MRGIISIDVRARDERQFEQFMLAIADHVLFLQEKQDRFDKMVVLTQATVVSDENPDGA